MAITTGPTTTYLELRGKRLRCAEATPLEVLVDLAEAIDSGNEWRALAQMSRTFKVIVVPEDHPELDKILNSSSDPVSFQELGFAFRSVIDAHTRRLRSFSKRNRRGKKWRQ